jgi:hypothetical protein
LHAQQINAVDEILFEGEIKKYLYTYQIKPNQIKDSKNADRIASNISSAMSSLSKEPKNWENTFQTYK